MPLLGRSPSEMKRLNCSDLWQSSSYGTVEVVPEQKRIALCALASSE